MVFLPEPLTYADGAQVACGFGTVYEALEKIGCSGNDAVLVVGLGPVGLAALMLAKAMGANLLLGVDVNPERIELAKKLGLVDDAFAPDGALEKVRARTFSSAPSGANASSTRPSFFASSMRSGFTSTPSSRFAPIALASINAARPTGPRPTTSTASFPEQPIFSKAS